METRTLNNGVVMPALGFGVFQTPPDETRDAVRAVLDSGYGLIDTAAAYGNERQVGEALYDSHISRSEVFLETKIWISDYGYHETLHSWLNNTFPRRCRPDRPQTLLVHLEVHLCHSEIA